MTSNLASTEIADHALQLRRESEDLARKKSENAASASEEKEGEGSEGDEAKENVKESVIFL